MKTFNLLATAAAGIESIVGKELRNLGYQTQVENGRVRFQGTVKDIINANLWLRTADRIKIIVGEFQAKTFDELFEKTKALPWDELLPMDANFPMEGRSHQSQLHSVPDVQAIAKKAVVSKLNTVYHRRTFFPENGDLYPLEVSIVKDHVMLTLDTTGDSLFKRGYRKAKGVAPLKENMAAALILLTNWKSDMPFCDPMCGSGTLPIEATLIARNIAPGFNRDFICEKWHWVDPEIAQSVRDDADNQADYDTPLQIFASDIDPEMVAATKLNATEAGVQYDIQVKQQDVKDFHTDLMNGVIVSNPPYGERMDDQSAVEHLYHVLGQQFKPLKTWSKYILTSDLNFEKAYGQKATKKRKLYNGSLRTDYFQYWGRPVWHH